LLPISRDDPVSPPYQSVYLFGRLLDLLIFDCFSCGFEDCKKVLGLSLGLFGFETF
jgi:hypothetical protein